MNIRDAVQGLVAMHGDQLVAQAIRFLPRVISLLKQGRHDRLERALDEAHTDVDKRADLLLQQFRARHPEATGGLPLDPDSNGEGHE